MEIKKFFKKHQLIIISFLIGFIGMMVIYGLVGMFPFGNKTVLTMDMSAQYVNYLAYFRGIVLGENSMLYNFSMNLGSNCYGLFAYYLSSPLNFLLCFFSLEHITEALLLLNIIKVALCSVTMTIFLKNSSHLKKSYVLLLSIMYAFMSYNIVYSQNIMWLDGSIYLPLVILGIHYIFEKRSSFLYIVSLFFCIFSNFYVGYMVGLFSVIYMVIHSLQVFSGKGIKAYWKFHKNAIFSYIRANLITLLLAMIILFPVFLNLLGSKSDIQANKFLFNTYYSPLDIFSKMAIGTFDFNQLMFGPPNIYCGSLVLILVLLYFIYSKVHIKEKILYLLFIIVFLSSFIVVPFDLVFHMFQNPVWFPFRNSFLFSFLLLLIAARQMEHGTLVKFEDVFKVQLILIFILFILHKFDYSYLTTKNVILTTSFMLITGFMYYFYENKKFKYIVVFVGVVILEMILNGYQILKHLDYVDREGFISNYYDVKNVIEKYKGDSHSFYRVDNKVARSINDSMFYGYNGFYHYSSLSGKKNKSFLTTFGIRHNLVRENVSDNTLPMASLLSVKYYINKVKKDYVKELFIEKEENVFENPYIFGVGFLADESIERVTFTENDPLENQNRLLKSIIKTDSDILEKVELANLKMIEKPIGDDWYLEYSTLENPSDFELYLDGVQYKKAGEAFQQNIIYIPKVVQSIEIRCSQKFQLKAYRYHHKNFEKIYEKIKENPFTIEQNKEHYIRGSIKTKKKGIFTTSIIADSGWTVVVDGKKVKPKTVADGFIAFDLNKGQHIIEFSYHPPGIYLGFITFIIGIVWLFIDKIKNIWGTIQKERRA